MLVHHIDILQMIVEKKFINLDSAPFNPGEGSSYSTIFGDRDNTQTFSTELHQLNCRQEPFVTHQTRETRNNKNYSSLLTYSRSCSQSFIQDILPSIKKILSLLSSQSHIQQHVESSLAMKGYKPNLCVDIGKVIASSFAEYVSLAKSLNQKAKNGPGPCIEEAIGGLNREMVSLKMQNSMQEEKIQWLEEENRQLKEKLSQLLEENREKSHFEGFRKEIEEVLIKLDSFQTEVYKHLGKHQQSLLQLSHFRNSLTFNSPKPPKSQPQNDRQATNLLSQIEEMRGQLTLQQSLYDQLLDRNIFLQKQIYFLSNKDSESSSFSVVESKGQFGQDCLSPSN